MMLIVWVVHTSAKLLEHSMHLRRLETIKNWLTRCSHFCHLVSNDSDLFVHAGNLTDQSGVLTHLCARVTLDSLKAFCIKDCYQIKVVSSPQASRVSITLASHTSFCHLTEHATFDGYLD